MSRKRRQVLQLDEPGKESFLARYGYHRQEEAEASPDIRDQDQSQQVEPEHDGSCVYDAQTPPLPSSPAPRRNPDIDDKLANFLAEIDAMDTEPAQNSKEENHPTNGTTVDKGWMLGSGDTSSIPVPASSAPSKPSYSMFVKGGSEILGSSGKAADSKKKDKEENIELPKEPVTPWQQCLDEGTQYYYYWNTKTNEVTWEIPTEYTQYLLRKKEYTEQVEKLQKEGKLKKDDQKKESNGTSVSQDPVSQEADKKGKTPKDPNSAEKRLKLIPEPSSSKSKRDSSGTSDSSSDSEASNKASSLVPYDLHRSVTSTSGSTKQNKQQKRRRSDSSDNNSSDKSAEGTKVRVGSELSDTVESTKNDDKRDKTDDDSKGKDEEELDLDIDDIDRELEMALERKREELLKLETEEKKSSKSNDKDKDKKDKKHKKKDKEDKHHKDDKKKEDRRRRKDDRKDDDRSSKDDKKRDEKRHKHSSDKKDRKEKEKEKEKELPLKKSLIETMREAVEEKRELELKRKRAIEELMAKELERTVESKHGRKRHHREDSAESRKRHHRDEVEERRVRDDYDDEWNRVYKDGREVDWDRVPPLGPHTAPPPTAEMLAYKDEKKHVVDYGHTQGEPDKKVGPADSTELELKKLEALQLAELALSKLEFLEVTKKGLSKLQILLIELETRHQDWQAGGLTTQHFLAKLREANWQLEQYEESAAPPLWSCHWDRAYRRYFYVHKLTSVTQWEYPDPDDPTALDGTHGRTSDKDRMETDLVSSAKIISHTRGMINSAYTKHSLDRGSKKQGTSELLAGVALLPPPPPPPPEEHPSVKSLMLHYGSGSSSSQEEDEDDEKEEERKKEERKKKAFRSETPAVKEEDVEAAMKEILEGPLQPQEGTQLGIQETLPVAYGKTAPSSSANDIPPVFGPQRPPPDYQEIGPTSDPQELSEGNGGAEMVSRDEQDSIYTNEFSTTELSTSVPMDIDSEVSQSNEDIIGEGHQDPGEGQLKPAIISRAPVIQGPQLCDSQSAPFYGATINSDTPVDGSARHMESAEEKERKKKKKDKEKDKEKVIAPGGISLKKRQVSSLVMKWQKVKKEVEEEERHRMEREAEIRKKLEEWKDQT